MDIGRRRFNKLLITMMASVLAEPVITLFAGDSHKAESQLEEKLKTAHKYKSQITPIRADDIGIQYPDDIPEHPAVRWEQPLPSFYEASVDVIFHGKLYDRIQLLRIDPEHYKFGVHNDPGLHTIEDWRQHLGAIAVINGSYYKSRPYGDALTPILEQGVYKGPKRYISNNGVFLAEPTDSSRRKATFVDFGQKPARITERFLKGLGYDEAVVSYPTLLDYKGRVRAKNNPRWRATRTFIGMDRKGYVILGNTQSGFFSLNRLGNFLKSAKELDLSYVLNMDGGPPACMDAKAGNFSYTNYGIWETNDCSGEEKLYWNRMNQSRWKIPNVISVKARG